jgi:hypothetical protein
MEVLLALMAVVVHWPLIIAFSLIANWIIIQRKEVLIGCCCHPMFLKQVVIAYGLCLGLF